MKSWVLGRLGALAAAAWLIGCGGNSTGATGAGGNTDNAHAGNSSAGSGGRLGAPTSAQGGNAPAGSAGMSGAATTSETGCNTSTACGNAFAVLPCPANLQSFSTKCTGDVRIERYSSSCGGTVIHADKGFYSQAWTFSSTGELVGTSTSADLAHVCYGTSCGPLPETRQVLCDFAPAVTGGDCVRPLQELCVPPPVTTPPTPSSCPASAEECLAVTCARKAPVERYPSSCGGVNIGTVDVATETWSYDASGTLVGVAFTADVDNACMNGHTTVYGKVCTATGPAVDACQELRGAGGAAGGANGGAGGAD